MFRETTAARQQAYIRDATRQAKQALEQVKSILDAPEFPSEASFWDHSHHLGAQLSAFYETLEETISILA